MAGEWTEQLLGGLLSFSNGKSSPERSDRLPHPVYGSNGIIGFSDETNSDPNTIVVGRVGSYCGSLHYSDRTCWVTDNAIRATARDENDTRFLLYLLQTLQLNNWRAGSGQPLLNQTILSSIPVTVPPLPEQRGIAHILGTLDDKIELNRRMNETLEAMARALFKDWFVDFGPTRRKIEGATDPVAILGGLAPNPEKAATIAALFPATIAENGMPDGWASRPIGEALSDTIGGDWGKEEADSQNDQAVAIIRGTDFPDLKLGGVAKAPTRFTTQKKLERRKLEGFDILIEVSGGSPTQPTGRSMIVTDSILHRFNTPVVCASFCRRFRPVDRKTAAFLYQHLTTLYESGDTWEYQNQSTGISNFQTTHFLKTEHIVDPGSPALEAYSEIVMPMILRANSNENLELARARDLVLPKLISGEIRLRDVDGAIGKTSILTSMRNLLLPGLMSGEVRTADADRIVKELT